MGLFGFGKKKDEKTGCCCGDSYNENSMEKAKDAIEGKTGTLIYNDWFVKRILNIMIIWIIFRILFMYKQGYIFNHLK